MGRVEGHSDDEENRLCIVEASSTHPLSSDSPALPTESPRFLKPAPLHRQCRLLESPTDPDNSAMPLSSNAVKEACHALSYSREAQRPLLPRRTSEDSGMGKACVALKRQCEQVSAIPQAKRRRQVSEAAQSVVLMHSKDYETSPSDDAIPVDDIMPAIMLDGQEKKVGSSLKLASSQAGVKTGEQERDSTMRNLATIPHGKLLLICLANEVTLCDIQRDWRHAGP